jgi:hypothetical protein
VPADPRPRYTLARAFADEAAARAAWEALARAVGSRPDLNLSVYRFLTDRGRHAVALVASTRPSGVRPLERLLTRAPGGVTLELDAGAADALHARRAATAPPAGRRGVTVLVERRPNAAEGLRLPYHPSGRPEPGGAGSGGTPGRTAPESGESALR